MKIVFFTLNYPPDLGAGSFRAVSLVNELSKKIGIDSYIHVITTHPNRYSSHQVDAKDSENNNNVFIHRIKIPYHGRGMFSQLRVFVFYAIRAFKLSSRIKPNFIIGTSSRLMTGVLTYISSRYQKCKYFIDLRDIFSETISDIYKSNFKFFSACVKYFFSKIEKRVLISAAGVNIVSQGFYDYFENLGIDTSNWLFFPNGVDDEFINFKHRNNKIDNSIKNILYAGNIGNGQGLEKIVPEIAKKLGNNYKFVIIGDGSSIELLEKKIKLLNLDNVELIPPIRRNKLFEYYINSDILFLHLNNLKAFERVLPSKIFEYAAIGKPIVAGLNGYSANFLKGNVEYSQIFEPGNVEEAVSCILNVNFSVISEKDIKKFTNKYSRKSIMNKMTDELTQIIGESVE